MTTEKQQPQATTEKNTELMLSYLMNSNYFQYLRHTYTHFLSLQDEEKDTLVRNGEIFRVKEDHSIMSINYSQPTLSIIIYGELKIADKLYSKSSYFVSSPEKIQVHFLKKTALMMLNNLQIQELMTQYELYYTKKAILEKTLPTQIMELDKKDFKILCNAAEMIENENSPFFTMTHKDQAGVYLLFEGIYSLSTKQKIKISELVVDYFGQECLWGQKSKYQINPQTIDYKYMWISKNVLIQVLSSDVIQRLKQIHIKRQTLRDEIQRCCIKNLELAKSYRKGKDKQELKKKKKRFTPEQIQQFQNILQMTRRNYKPKWKLQQEKIKQQKLKKMKEKRIYVPKKPKSKYFSTLTDSTFPEYYQTIHKTDENPFHLKLRLKERASTQVLSHRRPRTEEAKRSFHELEMSRKKTAYPYYSQNYDRSYSMGMKRLAKMQKYDHLKQASTLKRGEKIFSTPQLQNQLSKSLLQLKCILESQSRRHRTDPNELFEKSMRKTQLLAKKIMETRGDTTWR